MPSFLQEINDQFSAYLNEYLPKNPLKCEYYLALPITNIIESGRGSVKVLSSPDHWFGVTYAADKPVVVAALKEKTQQGLYPDGLWD